MDRDSMKEKYGAFYDASPIVALNESKVPRELWPLLPYAEFWGISDDCEKWDLVKNAPPEIQENLKRVVSAFDDELDKWLAGPEADRPGPSDEYVAFTDMRMAALFV